MQNLKDNRYFKISLYAFGVIAASVILLMIIQNFKQVSSYIASVLDIISPFIWGFAFAYILNYPYKWLLKLTDKLKFKKIELTPTAKKIVSIIVTYVAFIALMALFFYIAVPQIVTALSDFIEILPAYMENLSISVQAFLYKYLTKFGLSIDDIFQILTEFGEKVSAEFNMRALFGNVIDLVLSLSVKLKNIFLGLIVSIYFLLDKDRFRINLKKVLYATVPKDIGDGFISILSFTDKTFGGFFVAKVADSAIIGILNYLFMVVMGMEYAILISVIIGITNIIPFFGPFIGAIPSVFLLLLVRPWHALIFTIFIIVLQQFDGNFLGPKLMGDTMGIRAVFVVFAVIFFGGLFGFLGMFVGVPMFVVIYRLLADAVTKRLKEKNIDIS